MEEKLLLWRQNFRSYFEFPIHDIRKCRCLRWALFLGWIVTSIQRYSIACRMLSTGSWRLPPAMCKTFFEGCGQDPHKTRTQTQPHDQKTTLQYNAWQKRSQIEPHVNTHAQKRGIHKASHARSCPKLPMNPSRDACSRCYDPSPSVFSISCAIRHVNLVGCQI